MTNGIIKKIAFCIAACIAFTNAAAFPADVYAESEEGSMETEVTENET